MDTAASQVRLLTSKDESSILDFMREYLPAIRKGEMYFQLTGADLILVACIREVRGRVQPPNLLPHKVQRARKWYRPLLWVRGWARGALDLLRPLLYIATLGTHGMNDRKQSTTDAP
jgi:hypothetical protein